MNTGVVMQIENGRAVVLGAGGQFLRLKAQTGWQVGDTVAFKKPVEKKKIWYGITAVAACFVLVLGLVYGGAPAFFQPSSVIGIDINPSIELRLDKEGAVAEAVGYNPEGEAIVQQVELEGLPYQRAVVELLSSPEMQPYLEQKEYINFSVYSGEQTEEILEFIGRTAAELTAIHPQIKAACERVEEKVAKQARQHGMTPGKMRAIMELQGLDPNATVDEYADDELGEIKRCIEAHKGKGGQANSEQRIYQEQQPSSQSGQPDNVQCPQESGNMHGMGKNQQEPDVPSGAMGQGKQHGRNSG